VVSIKRNTADRFPADGYQVHAGGTIPLHERVAIHPDDVRLQPAFPVVGTDRRPEWLRTDGYDVDAAAAPGAIPPSVAGKAPADRFKLVVRREAKELPVCAITVGKGCPKLKVAATQEKDCPAEAGTRDTRHAICYGRGRGLHAAAADLDDLALFVANWTDRPVINRARLTDLFLFSIDTEGWTPMRPRQPNPDGSISPEAESLADPSRSAIFMIFSRLGLNLEPSRGPVDLYIIESAKRPTPTDAQWCWAGEGQRILLPCAVN
jgi:uncharacterized protein (TIGR03435 family)